LPNLEEAVSNINSCRVIRSFTKGYYQIALEEEAQAKTAFISPFGNFQFVRVTFGLRNAPFMFQGLMEVMLRECVGVCKAYIDIIDGGSR